MADFMDTDDYPAVRAAIDVSLTSDHISDTIIAMPIYHRLAERKVRELYPDADSETDPDHLEILKRATIFICASLLIPAVPRLVKESMGLYSYTRTLLDMETQMNSLWTMAENEISTLTEIVLTDSVPTLFTLAVGTRGA